MATARARSHRRRLIASLWGVYGRGGVVAVEAVAVTVAVAIPVAVAVTWVVVVPVAIVVFGGIIVELVVPMAARMIVEATVSDRGARIYSKTWALLRITLALSSLRSAMASAMFAFAFAFSFTFTFVFSFTFVFTFVFTFKFVIVLVLVDVGRNQCFIVKWSHSKNLLVPRAQWRRGMTRRIIVIRRMISIIKSWRIVITFRMSILVVVRKFKFLIVWWERMVQWKVWIRSVVAIVVAVVVAIVVAVAVVVVGWSIRIRCSIRCVSSSMFLFAFRFIFVCISSRAGCQICTIDAAGRLMIRGSAGSVTIRTSTGTCAVFCNSGTGTVPLFVFVFVFVLIRAITILRLCTTFGSIMTMAIRVLLFLFRHP